MVVFRAHLVKKGLSSRTIASYMTAVRMRLCLNGVSLHENQYLMKQMHCAAQCHDVNRIRHPVTKTLLDQVLLRIELVTMSAFETSLFLSIFTLSYHGMFQIGKLVESEHALKVRNILQAENSSWLRCIQHSSKTMRPGDMPQVIDIYPESDPFCLCTMAEGYTRLRQRAVPFWGRNPAQFFVHQYGARVSKDQVLRVLRRAVRLIPGLDEAEFGTHSFRSGKATDLFLKGKPDAEIMSEGRWTSAAFRKYIKP